MTIPLRRRAIRFAQAIGLAAVFTIASNSIPSSVLVPTQDPHSYLLLAFSLLRALFWMLAVPLLFIHFVEHKQPEAFAWAVPADRRAALRISLLWFAVSLPVVFLLAGSARFLSFYTSPDVTPLFFVSKYIVGTFLYYLGESFLFFGFLLWSIRGIAPRHAAWTTSALFALFHFAKPFPELFIAFFAGLLFSHLTTKTRSVLPATVVHFILALILNVAALFLQRPASGATL